MHDLTLVPFGWPVVFYLTLAGIAAGASLTGAAVLLRGAASWRPLGRRGLLVAAVTIVAGSLFLIADLEAPSQFLLILAHFNPASIMSWAARLITLFGLLALYCWWAIGRTSGAALTPGLRFSVALTGLLGLLVGLYPAFVLGQAVARPLWGSPLLVPLFLISAVHTGLAALLLWRVLSGPAASEAGEERLPPVRLEVALIATQAFALAFYLSSQAGYDQALARMTRGDLALWLWGGVVLAGWIVPLVEVLMSGASSARLLGRAVAILIGGFALRALIVFGGQGSAALLSMNP